MIDMNVGPSQPSLVPAVGAVVVDARGRVLLIRRARPPHQGIWTLPGGKIEASETAAQAVVREVEEETGLVARVLAELGTVEIRGEGFAYRIEEHLLAPLSEGPLRAADDASDARWATRAELDSLGVAPEAIAVIERGLAHADRRSSQDT